MEKKRSWGRISAAKALRVPKPLQAERLFARSSRELPTLPVLRRFPRNPQTASAKGARQQSFHRPETGSRSEPVRSLAETRPFLLPPATAGSERLSGRTGAVSLPEHRSYPVPACARGAASPPCWPGAGSSCRPSAEPAPPRKGRRRSPRSWRCGSAG